MKCDLHIHSNYSFDSLMSPARIVRTSKLRDLSVISVTDHNNMNIYANEFSAENRNRIFEKYGVRIIPGVEVKTDCGDVIGLFLEKEVSGSEFDDVVDQIQEQEGLVVLPHPYHRDADPANLVQDVDLIECINGRCKSEKNDQAIELAEETDLPVIGGSDAHMYWEIGQITTHFSGEIASLSDSKTLSNSFLESKRNVRGTPLPFLLTHGVSYASGRLKRVLGCDNQ